MDEWWTYRLSDFLLFSPRTYYRMFELYHQQVWPAHLILPSLVVAGLILFRSSPATRSRAIGLVLAASWLWVGSMFHLQPYAAINWAAKYFAVLFAAQGLLLLWLGVVRGRLRFTSMSADTAWVGTGLFLTGALLSPMAGLLAGRTWRQLEVVGLTPDPTAIATLGALALSAVRAPRLLLIIPIAWCLIGAATLWALGSVEAWIPLVAGLAGLALIARRGASPESSPDKPLQ